MIAKPMNSAPNFQSSLISSQGLALVLLLPA
jgi:hypothetical protein